MDLAVTDAHALIWAASGNLRKLGRKARSFYERVDGGRAVLYVPTHVLLEIGEAHAGGDFSFSGGSSFDVWVERLTTTGRYVPIDLTTGIVRQAQELYQIPERGDRIVAATARVMGCPLITRDPEIGKGASIQVVW